MLGDIVPNNTASDTKNFNAGGQGATAVAERPAPQPVASGYGASSFGPSRPIQPAPVAVQPIAPAPISQPAASQTPVEPTAVTSAPTQKSGIKAPLVLTIVGVLVFIGGVSGLFIYALSGS